MKAVAAACLILAAPAAPAAAAAAPDLAQQIVNDPGAPDVTGAKAVLFDDATVQGGKALRIQVPARGQNPWDSALASPVTKPVKAGDNLLLAFYAKLEKGEKGATTVSLPFAGIQLADKPWTPIFHEAVDLGPDWKLVKVSGKADKDYAPGTLRVTVQLATARQVVDVGPVILLDQGQ